MTIDGKLQGCFCETFENGGGIVHMEVTFVNPGIILRLTGGLGPLGEGHSKGHHREQG